MRNQKTKTLVGMGLLVATVVVLQMLGQFIKFGPFSISLVLVPIVIGAALYGIWAGATLGFIFGIIVLFTDAAAFLAYNVIGTIIVVLAKGTLAGLIAGIVYQAFEKKGQSIAVLLASIEVPFVNTTVFVIGCLVFFMPLIETWATGQSAISYVLFVMVGTNFLVEMAINVVLANAITRLIQYGKKG